MYKNDQQFTAQRIREQYAEKTFTDLDRLRALDAKVKRPADVFAYLFGSVSAIIMGAGMSLVMTDIGTTLGMSGSAMIPGICIGIVGMALALLTYPIHKAILRSHRKKFAPQIISLSEQIMSAN